MNSLIAKARRVAFQGEPGAFGNQAARESLRGNQNHAGCNIEGCNPHIAHARQRGRRIIRVQRR